MVISTDSVLEGFADLFVTEYANATVYADFEQETVLHRGQVRILATGWVELPSGRLLSPAAVHHIDT
jgi:hypothetical protein